MMWEIFAYHNSASLAGIFNAVAAVGGSGKKGPESQTLVRLAQACEVRFEWLNEGNGPMRRSVAGSSDQGDENGGQRLRGVDGDSLFAEAVRVGRAFDQIKTPEQREALIGVLRAFGVWK